MLSETTGPRVGPDGNGSRYARFGRKEWAELRASTPLVLGEEDLAVLQGINENVSLGEVEEVYLPLSRLLNLHVGATQKLHGTTAAFLGRPGPSAPYVIGIAGSVAVGKSTTARILQALLSYWPDHPKVDLVTTDGFLYPNRVLEERGLMDRKGFPESYDLKRLVRFVSDVKAGVPVVAAPVYSHLSYDVIPGEAQVVSSPDVLILEGLNVLQTSDGRGGKGPQTFVSDLFDFSIYVDAYEEDIERWYVERFMMLRRTVFDQKGSYFKRYAELSDEEARRVAADIWARINGPNLRENIATTRERARLVLEKGEDHSVRSVVLRKL
ncbi:type I pantothenate kinase [Rubrobacter marinus]|uniref:Pantothenate kinase n=1 Tax=Rubrobacter marinus TaxID=2653852 RepID=A0A6G8Q1V3_9ACTN|nr:type I pantothenate kinase [Rubrobacter marinus]QIN80415.1 type I pantothenate kinase [Rubrobacter marinus]